MAVKYEFKVVYIRFIGTHAEYMTKSKQKRSDMTIKPIKTERDYQSPQVIEQALGRQSEHSKGRPVRTGWSHWCEADEQKHYRIDPPDPIEAIKLAWTA